LLISYFSFLFTIVCPPSSFSFSSFSIYQRLRFLNILARASRRQLSVTSIHIS